MPVKDVLDDRQAKAGAAQLARAPAIHPVETLGESRKVLGRDALALVDDRHLRHLGRPLLALIARRRQPLAAGARYGDDDSATLATIFDGVVEEILENLDQLIAIADDSQPIVLLGA